MHKAGILDRRKVGTHVFYELADRHCVTIIETARVSLAQHAHELARLSAALGDPTH
jgi:hypothetical protein